MGCVHSTPHSPTTYTVASIDTHVNPQLAAKEEESSEDDCNVQRSSKSRSMELPFQHRKQMSPEGGQAYVRTASLQISKHSYQGAPLPANEAERIGYLHALNVLDTPAGESLNSIIKLVAGVLGVPIVAISLVDSNRTWLKAMIGMPQQYRDMPRKFSMAAWILLYKSPTVIVVEDTLEDARFKENPLVVGPPALRFYAGAPLTSSSNGLRLGALSIADTKARKLDADKCAILVKFANMIMKELERDMLLVKQRSESFLEHAHSLGLLARLDSCSDGVIFIDTAAPRWQILFANDACLRLLGGLTRADLVNGFMWDQFTIAHGSKAFSWGTCADFVAASMEFTLSVSPVKSAAFHAVEMVFRPANTHDEGPNQIANVPSFVHALFEDAPMNQYYFVVIKDPVIPRTPTTPSRRFTPKKQPFEDVKLGPLMGQGSFGRVYRGMWNGAQVAVKIIDHTLESITRSSSPDADVLLEAVMSSDLSHPNIVQTFKWATRAIKRKGSIIADALQSPSKPASATDMLNLAKEAAKLSDVNPLEPVLETWLVLEFCDCGSLQDAIFRGVFRSQGLVQDGSANMGRILTTAHEIAAGMAHLHSMDILHGDLTGGNILLAGSNKDDRQFVAKIADFGLSRIVLGTDSVNTHTYGTVTHQPPELLITGSLSKKVDIYAFGVVLWEMYNAQSPWGGLRHGEVIKAVAQNQRHLEFPTGTPLPFQELAYKCMALDPLQRPTFEGVMSEVEEMQHMLRHRTSSMVSTGFPMHLL